MGWLWMFFKKRITLAAVWMASVICRSNCLSYGSKDFSKALLFVAVE